MRELRDCPFRAADSVLTYLQSRTPILFLLIFMQKQHLKKWALAYYLDGQS